ncbi:protein FAR1-RELATED SEQUENCE 5-like [Lotus japonicus]|uniref:protein FAR1-RELATED SEQUENCE 5-like n=1 Tax=Lotus japonicus TaxID=34305 RepID=UPI00258712A0|nr:protein FAR1-RELATED SEQUENCE 5-like [Lotus japonicus]
MEDDSTFIEYGVEIEMSTEESIHYMSESGDHTDNDETEDDVQVDQQMYDSDFNGDDGDESEGRDAEINNDDGNNFEDQSEQDFSGEGELGFDNTCCITIDSLQDILRIDLKNLCPLDTSSYEFCDAEVAYLFYKWYARVNGFAVRKNNILRDKTEEVIQRRYVCSRQGKRRDNDNRVRKVRPETRCWCLAEFVIHVDKSSGRWRVKRFVDSHSHDLLPDEYTTMIASHRSMGEADILQMNNMRKAGLRGTDIFKSFAGQSGGFYNMGYNLKDMHNQISRQRRWEPSDATAAIEYLRGLKKNDSLIYCREKVSDEGRLELLFWSDGISQMSYQVFGDVLAFDATYGKNKHKCPFVVFCGINHHNKTTIFASAIVTNETEETYVWLLDNFLRAMKGKAPSSVITDGDPRMRNAIKRVFPRAHHRLCAWYLQKGAAKHVQITDFTRQLSKCMYFDLEVHEFERLWADVVARHGLEGNEWVSDLLAGL